MNLDALKQEIEKSVGLDVTDADSLVEPDCTVCDSSCIACDSACIYKSC